MEIGDMGISMQDLSPAIHRQIALKIEQEEARKRVKHLIDIIDDGVVPEDNGWEDDGVARWTNRDYGTESVQHAGPESELQGQCESWLKLHGYAARSHKGIEAGMPVAGWYVHLRETEKNPILGDLLILDLSGRWVEIELKTASGKLRKHQQLLQEQGAFRVVRSFDEFVETVRRFINI